MARLTGHNGIVIRTFPADAIIKLSPDLPGIDTSAEIRIRGGGTDRRINFRPSVRHMLEEYQRTGERVRLCFMKHLLKR